MSNEWAGVIQANMPKYVKGLESLVARERIIFAMLKKKGRIKYNESSYECKWNVQYSQPTVNPYEDGNLNSFTRHDPSRQLTIDWRGYTSTDVLSKKERLMAKSDVAIYKRYDRIASDLRQSMTDSFGKEVFVDGYAAGNESRLAGLESFMGHTTCSSSDKIAQPNDTYAGLATNLGDQGGSWSSDSTTQPNTSLGTDWPNGSGTSEYDYLAPKLLNTDHDWGGGSNGWSANAEYIIRRGVSWLRLTGGETGRPDLLLTNGEMLAEYKDSMSSKQRIVVPSKAADDLGFQDSCKQEGITLYDDFEVAPGVAYLLNVDKMSLRSLSDSLFFSEGPDYLLDNLSWRWLCGYFGNMTFSPKFFGKIADFT